MAVERKWRLTDIGLCPYGETETVSHINNNKCIGDDTKAAARESPKYINKTSSSAVAKRSCDPSCLSLFSFNSSLQNVEQSLLLLVTYATDLSLRAIKCYSAVFGVTLKLVVITFRRPCVQVSPWRCSSILQELCDLVENSQGRHVGLHGNLRLHRLHASRCQQYRHQT